MPMHYRQYLIFFYSCWFKKYINDYKQKHTYWDERIMFYASLNKMHCLRTHSFYFICESYVFMYLICKHGHLILYHIWKYLIDCLIEAVHIWFWKTVCWVNLKVTKCIQFMLTCGSINYHWWKFNREGLITQMVLW